MNTFVGAFTKQKMKILCEAHERNLGVRDFDWALFEFFSNKFNKENGCNPMKNQKAKIRMLDAISKQRKVLSANSYFLINFFYFNSCIFTLIYIIYE